MRISELAARCETSAHALRHYERVGLITAARSAGGYRNYADSVVREVRFIVMARRIGFSLKEIAQWLPAYRSRRLRAEDMIDALNERVRQIDLQIVQLRAQRRQVKTDIGWFRKSLRKPQTAATNTARTAPWPSSRQEHP